MIKKQKLEKFSKAHSGNIEVAAREKYPLKKLKRKHNAFFFFVKSIGYFFLKGIINKQFDFLKKYYFKLSVITQINLIIIYLIFLI